MPGVGLERANSLSHSDSFGEKRNRYGSERIPRVSIAGRFVLQFPAFTVRRIRPATSCEFGLAPKLSTTVEKTVEKPDFSGNEPLGAGPRTHRIQGKPA